MSETRNLKKILKKHSQTLLQWTKKYSRLKNDIQELVNERKKKNRYPVNEVILYNNNLEKVDPKKIKYILVGDNPGVEEQRCGYYFAETGRAGQLARVFFKKHMLVDCFDCEVLVLNKTFIHTPTTKGLKKLTANHESLIKESQEYMAKLLLEIMQALPSDKVEVWVVGISQMRDKKGVFQWFREELKNCDQKRVRLFKHFSYGHFCRDLGLSAKCTDKIGEKALKEILKIKGNGYRREILGKLKISRSKMS